MIPALVIASHPPLEEEVRHILAEVRVIRTPANCKSRYGGFSSNSETCASCGMCAPCALAQGNPRSGVVVYDGEVRPAVHLKIRVVRP